MGGSEPEDARTAGKIAIETRRLANNPTSRNGVASSHDSVGGRGSPSIGWTASGRGGTSWLLGRWGSVVRASSAQGSCFSTDVGEPLRHKSLYTACLVSMRCVGASDIGRVVHGCIPHGLHIGRPDVEYDPESVGAGRKKGGRLADMPPAMGHDQQSASIHCSRSAGTCFACSAVGTAVACT